MLSSDQRREHLPELWARPMAGMMTGQVVVSKLPRREGTGTSVLHQWRRQARAAEVLPVPTAAQRLAPHAPARHAIVTLAPWPSRYAGRHA